MPGGFQGPFGAWWGPGAKPLAFLLAAQVQAPDERLVARHALALQIIEQRTALADQHQQATARVEILGVDFEVLGEVGNTLGEQGDLDFRAASIVGGGGVFGDERGCALWRNRHRDIPSAKS